jgi:uncharacterized protein
MPKKQLTKNEALDLLHTHMQNKNLRRHCYAVGVALSYYFDYYKKINIEVGSLTKEQWEIAGILHDADWEETTNDPARHTLNTMEWLGIYEVPEELLDVLRTHNTKMTQLKNPTTLIEWTLECCDELTGFIVAVALVMPEKKLKDVTLERVLSKFKQKEFSRAVDRDQITQCKEKVGLAVDTFVEITLKAMQDNSDMLGL